MARNLRKYRAYDERTGRLERAIDLIEDGEIKGLKTTRREADTEHPQRRPLRIGPDRNNLLPGFRKQQTYEDAKFRFVFGYTTGRDLWAQRTTPIYSWGSGGFTLTATLVIDMITSASTGDAVSLSPLAFPLTASQDVTWSIVGGVDQALFELSGSTLRWLSDGTQDFSSPADSDTNNTYIVTVRATNSDGAIDEETITITVVP